MKKRIAFVLSTLMLVMMLAACGAGAGTSEAAVPDENGTAAESTMPEAGVDEADTDAEPPGDATELEFWTHTEIHVPFFEKMATLWNEKNPDRPIALKGLTLQNDDLNNKLLVSLQSGTGAPDIADIEISKFPNYLMGDVQLAPLNRVVEPELDNIVQSRVEIYEKDGNYYGIDFHIGAAVMYYNVELLEQAGVDYTSIVTWDDYRAAGQKVLDTLGIPMTTTETGDVWSWMPMLTQLGGDMLKDDGSANVDSAEMAQTFSFMQEMLKEGTMQVAAGGNHHTEEHYGFLNGGGAASISMPLWYMGRFTDYMPDLKGKIAIAPNPVWEEGQPRSVGCGGTGTAVTSQSENVDLAVDFLAFAKLSVEGNIAIWEDLGFDPIRTEVWNMEEIRKPNKYTEYFATNPFDVLEEIKEEIPGINMSDQFGKVFAQMQTSILFRVFESLEDPAVVLPEEQALLT